MIPHSIVEEVIAAAKILEVVQDYVPLKKKGGDWFGLCPFHDEKSGSLAVHPVKNIFKCFGCGRAGNAVGFLMAKGKSFPDAIRELGKKYNIEVSEDKPREYKRPEEVKTGLTEKAEKWFNNRGISKNTLLRFGICSSKEWMPQTDKEENCILFKYYRNSQLINIKYRDGAKNFKLVSGAELIFYNVDGIEKTSECVITEGEIDALSAYEAGIFNAVSVPNGAAKGNQRLEYLDNCIEYFLNKEKVYIATDNDKPGIALRDELARRIGFEKCWYVLYPEGCKDLNDVLVKLGTDAVKSCIETAQQPPITGIHSASDLFEPVKTIFTDGFPELEGTGYPYLDELVKFAMKRYTTITGVPGSGKSDLLDQILVRLVNRAGWKVGYFSPERDPEIHILKLCAVYAGEPFLNYPDRRKMSNNKFQRAMDWVNENFWFYNVEESDCTIDGILEIGRQLVQRKGINCLVIDPYNYVERKRPNGVSEVEYISEVLGKIKMFAKKYVSHPFLIAHPTKTEKDTDGEYKVPNLYSISGAAHFYNKTDNGIVVHRSRKTGLVDVHIQKVKHIWEGKCGMATFMYDTLTSRYKSEMGEWEVEMNWLPIQQYRSQPRLIPDDEPTQHEAWMDVLPEDKLTF